MFVKFLWFITPILIIALALYGLSVISDTSRYVADYELSDGLIYTGYIENGKLAGLGILVFENGDTYHGFFENSRFNGEGEFIFADGERIKGIFIDGVYRE